MSKMLTIQEAAVRAHRSRRTIENWIAEGLLDVVVIKNAKGTVVRRYLDDEELMRVYRKKDDPDLFEKFG